MGWSNQSNWPRWPRRRKTRDFDRLIESAKPVPFWRDAREFAPAWKRTEERGPDVVNTTRTGAGRGSGGRRRRRPRPLPSAPGGTVDRTTSADWSAVAPAADRAEPADLTHLADRLLTVAGPDANEPPPHLARALKAAATARARAARIRARQFQVQAEDRPRLEPWPGTGTAHRSGPRRTPRGQALRFTRTVAAANEARFWAAAEDGDDPWHLRLRESAEAEETKGWLSRLLKPLISHRKSAVPDQERLLAIPLAPANGPPMLGRPVVMAPVDEAQDGRLAGGELVATPSIWRKRVIGHGAAG